jgi:hypothetical protein
MSETILPCIYRSQRDNVDRPGSSCNVTSAVMVLEASGHPPTEIEGLKPGQQPEDFLSLIADSPEALEAMRERCPWFFKGGQAMINPAEAPTMLDWIVGKAYGRALLHYREDLMVTAIAYQIDLKRAVVLRGQFTPQGHVVACVGYREADGVAQNQRAITHLIVNDPWGDYMSGYKDTNGEHIALPMEIVIRVLRSYDSSLKVGHVVTA